MKKTLLTVVLDLFFAHCCVGLFILEGRIITDSNYRDENIKWANGMKQGEKIWGLFTNLFLLFMICAVQIVSAW